MTKKGVLIFSVALEGYASIFQDCILTQHEYCQKQNFKYLLVDQAPRKLEPFEAAWLKVFLLRSALKGDYEWIAFLDADCEVRSHTPSFVKEFEKQEGKSVFMAHGFSERINSGVIFIKNSKGAQDYLEKVINNGNKEVPDEDKAPYENGHMIHYGKNNPYVHIIDFGKWNNNRIFEKQSYIQHYSGGKLRKEFLIGSSTKERKQKHPTILERIKSFYRTKSFKPTMKDIQSLVPFYQEFYPEVFK